MQYAICADKKKLRYAGTGRYIQQHRIKSSLNFRSKAGRKKAGFVTPFRRFLSYPSILLQVSRGVMISHNEVQKFQMHE